MFGSYTIGTYIHKLTQRYLEKFYTFFDKEFLIWLFFNVISAFKIKKKKRKMINSKTILSFKKELNQSKTYTIFLANFVMYNFFKFIRKKVIAYFKNICSNFFC